MNKNMQKITTHLWFDKQALEAADFYTNLFPESFIKNKNQIQGPDGNVDVVYFSLSGRDFAAISAGPYFKINPSISFFINCDTEEDVRKYWEALNTEELMPLQQYPFAELYGWCKDKYGLTWQIILVKGEIKEKINPSLLFVNESFGKAEEAANYYATVFKNSVIGEISRYEDGDGKGKVAWMTVDLSGEKFTLMDGVGNHQFNFNEAISFMVYCDTQEEIDYYWEKLSHVQESEQCGWCKDRFGISWQIVPKRMDEMIIEGTEEQKKRVTEAFMQMKKFDLEKLEAVYIG